MLYVVYNGVESESAISNDENGCRHMCLFIRIFINNFYTWGWVELSSWSLRQRGYHHRIPDACSSITRPERCAHPPPIVVIRESGLTLIVLELELELEYQQSNQTSHSHQPKIYPTVFKRYFLIGLNDNEKFFLFLLFLLLLLPCKGEW